MNASQRRQQQIKRVCDYIDTHLDETLSLDVLSQVAICSKYHFQRVFSAYVGISATQYVLLTRLKRASFRLVFEGDVSITDIAFEAQFESSEAFTRAFSRVFSQTPSQFRTQPEWQHWHSKYEFYPDALGEKALNVEIIDFAEEPVAVLEHKGSPHRIFDNVAKFVEWRKSTGFSPIRSSRTYGVAYSDPAQTPPEEFRFDICGSHVGDIPENQYGVKTGVIPAGRCAAAIHKGSHSNIGETICRLYQEWLPESGEELREYPVYFRYLNFIHEVDECDLLTEVYLPIR
ncbi:AraC family transcriptional regulator [Vibrio sp. SCSIO 43136]|uniref:AraC family transcriptional regulator n=1 Tax=Vibrio sp. SCSIO 43136 TaxID=2819101 RepID=UPI002074BA90|nr:AraC family transcriptional regulator [Vibrio sp. SCSIO 43136]USD67550.1 AraC family transcriptional regulator [Vibrio sp. SCSIO 43136]